MVLLVAPARYFGALISFHMCTGPLDKKNWEKMEKVKKYLFSGNICKLGCAREVLKSYPKAQF